MTGDIYIGTILLETNRWAPGKVPTYRVSEWVERFARDGFDGMELWANHVLLATPEERAALTEAARAFPAAVFSAYADLGPDGAGRDAVTRAAAEVGARAVKFNVGPDIARRAEELERAAAWKEGFAPGVRFLCECHPGTWMEDPEAAAGALEALGEGFGAIVHPFNETPGSLERWFDALGGRIAHAHVQVRDEEDRLLRLDARPAHAREILDVLRERGFGGSFTLEFTEGTGRSGENAEQLYASALADLAFLRGA